MSRKNPFVLKPGEMLNLEQLLDRYLDWGIWNHEHKRESQLENCDLHLHHSLLCCQEHYTLSHEHDDFDRYFNHLILSRYRGFSIFSMKKLIIENNLRVSVTKITRYWQITIDHWLSVDLDDQVAKE